MIERKVGPARELAGPRYCYANRKTVIPLNTYLCGLFSGKEMACTHLGVSVSAIGRCEFMSGGGIVSPKGAVFVNRW